MIYRSRVDEFKQTGQAAAGLCATCRHRKEYRNSRGSVFLYCGKSESDPGYPKYPRLPMLTCPAHEPPGPAHGS